MSRSAPARRQAWAVVALTAGLLVTVPQGPAAQGADDTCVGKGEYGAIANGMSIQQLTKAVHGQVPFAETAGKGKQRYRWYVACDAWQPDLDVYVRYHLPVVGRRTVSKKGLDVYVAPAITPRWSSRASR